MNDTPNPADFALAMYATACETHMRRDWREACHALAKALKAEQMASASRATLATAAPMPEPVTPANSPAKASKAPKATRVAKGAESFDMTAGSLARALRLVCRTITRGEIPIIHNVALCASLDSLTLRTTDLDREITVAVDAPGLGEWVTTCDAKALRDMLAKASTSAAVDLALDADARLCVTIGRAVSHLSTLPIGDFPTFAESTWTAIPVNGGFLSDLRFVQPAISTEEVRYYLNGAYLHAVKVKGKTTLRTVATDGHRLHMAERKPLPDTPDVPGMIIPRLAVADMLATMGDGDGMTLERGTTSGGGITVRVQRGAVAITSKLVDGSFPDYQRVIPTDSKFTVRADRAELAGKVAGVASVSKEKRRSVRFTAEGGALTLHCRDLEGGKAADVLEVDYTETPAEGEEPDAAREWGLNALYVKEALASLDGDVVTFAGTAPSDPFKLTGADSSRLVILMPLRV